MKFHKFVVLIIVLLMLAGLSVYAVLDSDLFVHQEELKTTNVVSNTISNK